MRLRLILCSLLWMAVATDAANMRAAQVSGYGEDASELLSISDTVPRPQLPAKGRFLLVRVQAASLAPGDCRVMTGKTRLVQGPPSFPYIPGGDLCGTVVEVSKGETQFKAGDPVVAMFDTAGPRGALAEYKVVKAENAVLKPAALSAEDAAALPSSALTAMLLCERHVRSGDRVLVLGGGGGVGCHLVQLLKPHGASYVAATSTQKEDLLGELGVDRVIDRTKENWWEIAEFKDTPFDLVVDLYGTREPWNRAASSGVVKSGRLGGRFVTTVGDTPYMKFRHWWHIFPLMYDMTARSLWTGIFRSKPRWSYHLGLEPKDLARLLRRVEAGELRAVLDSTHQFDLQGLQEAFRIQKSRRAHGKVVIVVAKE
ncbi:EO [Symbiodinium natans]|uniref:EO protein n=1 Tax=Symbiodinium natans TaxID=878477 RepID=A0A812QWR6_9DINO|nr:EO [Symbiodinium natans]